MAHSGPLQHHGAVPAWNSFSFAFGPLVAVAVVGGFAVILKWAFGRGASVVAGTPKAGASDEYGLLVPIASPPTYVEGEVVRRRLEDSGVRATLTTTLDGPRVMVWPQDAARAREVLASGR